MEESRPEPDRISAESQFRTRLAEKFGKHDVNGNDVRIQAVRARCKDQVVPDTSKVAIPPAPQMVGGEPPQEVESSTGR
jgi:hypothetical protein